MTVTKKDMSSLHPDAISIGQKGSKQLFIVEYLSYSLLISYRTIIGVSPYNELTFYLTEERLSPTTSKQMTQFSRSYNCERLKELAFKAKLGEYHG